MDHIVTKTFYMLFSIRSKIPNTSFQKKKSTGSKYLNHSKPFIEYANDIDGIHKNIEECNPN